jgi:hypothetical protein
MPHKHANTLTRKRAAELREQIASLGAILAEHCTEDRLEVAKVAMLSAVGTGTAFKTAIKWPGWLRTEPRWVKRLIRETRNRTRVFDWSEISREPRRRRREAGEL